MNFLDKVVLVTGGANGIGKETAGVFAKEGAKLALVDLKMETLEAAAKDLGLAEGKYVLIAADVAKEDQVKRYVQSTIDAFQRIDVFFNNAGIEGALALVADYPTDVMERVIDVNFKGAFWGMQNVLKIMLQQNSGSIVNMASIAGLIGGLGYTSIYNATKHAVVGFTKAAAAEYAATGIRINAVCPAMVNTRMIKAIEKGISPDNPAAVTEELKSKLPMGRYAEPIEIANVVLFLASEKASYVTGVALPVDAGLLANG